MSDKTSNASFVRWQAVTIQQLGAVNNLLIGLATGIIALECKYIFEKVDFSLCEWLVLAISILCLMSSIALGLCTAWNRLLDFRWTARIARRKSKGDFSFPKLLRKLRKKVKFMGSGTWRFFCWQSKLFVFGSALLPILAFSVLIRAQLKFPQYRVEGQILRISIDGRVEKASAAEIHIFLMPDGAELAPNAEVNHLQRESKQNCDAIASALHRQYAETVQGIDPRLVSNPIGTSLQEEWMYIQARPEFDNLSDSKKRLVKQAFWLRRAQVGRQDAFDEAKLQHLWEIIFDTEIKEGRVSTKRQNDPFISDQQAFIKEAISEERLEKGTISENADADGRFSFGLKPGTFLIIAEGKLPEEHSETAESNVWVKTITVPQQNSVVLAKPFCEP